MQLGKATVGGGAEGKYYVFRYLDETYNSIRHVNYDTLKRVAC